MDLFWHAFDYAYENFLFSRDYQDYIFSSEGVIHLTIASLVIAIPYLIFGPDPKVHLSTIGDENDLDREEITSSSSAGEKVPVGYTADQEAKTTLPRKVEMVKTPIGAVRVTVVGDLKAKGKLLSFHDVGLNHRTCFTRFFQFRRGEERNTKVWEQFVQFHIDVPGSEEEAEDLADSMSMDDFVGVVHSVVEHFSMGCFVGFGVGAGANVLLRYAMQKPEYVQALLLVGASAEAASKNERRYYSAVLKVGRGNI